LSLQLAQRDFTHAETTIAAMQKLERDNVEALEAQSAIDKLHGKGIVRQVELSGGVLSASFLQNSNRVIAVYTGVIGRSPSARSPGVAVIDSDTGEKISDTQLGRSGRFFTFSRDGHHALSDGEGLVRFDLENGARATFYASTGTVNCAAFLGDKNKVLIGGDEFAQWDLELNVAIRRYKGHTGRVQAIAVTPDNIHALTAADDSTIRFWSLTEGKALWSIEGPRANFQSLAISPDGARALSGGVNSIRVLELKSGREIDAMVAHNGPTLSLAISRDGRRALSGGTDNIVRLWDLETTKQIHAYLTRHEWTSTVGFSADGRRAIFGTLGGGALHVVILPD
jgi:WD40 repeat protein